MRFQRFAPGVYLSDLGPGGFRVSLVRDGDGVWHMTAYRGGFLFRQSLHETLAAARNAADEAYREAA